MVHIIIICAIAAILAGALVVIIAYASVQADSFLGECVYVSECEVGGEYELKSRHCHYCASFYKTTEATVIYDDGYKRRVSGGELESYNGWEYWRFLYEQKVKTGQRAGMNICWRKFISRWLAVYSLGFSIFDMAVYYFSDTHQERLRKEREKEECERELRETEEEFIRENCGQD